MAGCSSRRRAERRAWVWLVTDQLPRQLLRPQAVAGEETGHGRQGSLLGSAGTRGQTCDVDSDGMPGGSSTGHGGRSSGMAGRVSVSVTGLALLEGSFS